MKKLILLLVVVPLAGICQTQSYKVKETTSSSQQYINSLNSNILPEERTFEIENTSRNNQGAYRNPQYVAPPVNNTANYIQDASQNISNSISAIARNAAANAAANSINKPSVYIDKKSLRGVELNTYKYIVIQESNYNSYRKAAVKVLKKAGFNVVNLHKTSRTHKVIPSDLQQNPDLGLYLYIDVVGFGTVEAIVRLFNYNNKLLFNSSGRSSMTGSKAVKNALSSYETYGYKYNPNIVRKKQIDREESTSVDIENSSKEEAINEVKQLKELLYSGILNQEEYDKKAAELKKIILGN